MFRVGSIFLCCVVLMTEWVVAEENPSDEMSRAAELYRLLHRHGMFAKSVPVSLEIAPEFQSRYPLLAQLLSRAEIYDCTKQWKSESDSGEPVTMQRVLRLLAWCHAGGDMVWGSAPPPPAKTAARLPVEIRDLWTTFGGWRDGTAGCPPLIIDQNELLVEAWTGRTPTRSRWGWLDLTIPLRHLRQIGYAYTGDELFLDVRDQSVIALGMSEGATLGGMVRSRLVDGHGRQVRLEHGLVEMIEDIALRMLAVLDSQQFGQLVRHPPEAVLPLPRLSSFCGQEFVCLPAGRFLMGSPEDEYWREEDEEQQEQSVDSPLWMATHEVTVEAVLRWLNHEETEFQSEWLNPAVADESDFWRSEMPILRSSDGFVAATDVSLRCPISGISSLGARAYCRWLTNQDPDASYRLPTEIEWEYACRAGTTTACSFGSHMIDPDPYAWYRMNADRPQPVGTRLPNRWGLFDMYGNVAELCTDPVSSVRRPLGSSDRVAIRGGGTSNSIGGLRSAQRDFCDEDDTFRTVGFRIVRVPMEP